MVTRENAPGSIVEGDRQEAEPKSGLDQRRESFLDVLFGTLSNERRRKVVRYMASEPEPTTLGTLAERIAVSENDITETELSSSQRKRVYVGLYQCHLPKMDAADVVDFDEDRKTVHRGENLGTVHECLALTERLTEPSDPSRQAPTVTVASVLDSIATSLRSFP